MRLNDSKNKRMLIMEQINMRQKSREKQRKSSAERRRKIQQNLNDFAKTMSNVSFRNTGNSSGFRYEQPYSERHDSYQELQKPKQTEKQILKEEYDQVLRSPSFKDINLGLQNESRMELSNQSIKQSKFLQKQQNFGNEKENKANEEINEKQIIEVKEQMKILTPNSLVQNESSASAIFFTSQFNEFISKNHISSRQQIQLNQNEPSQSQKIHKKQLSNDQINESSNTNQFNLIKQQSPSKTHIIQGHQIQQIDRIAQTKQQVSPVPQTIEQDRKSTLIKNKSGHSLAFSNQSSLKYSLNESNIKEILNRKFTNQLIADTIQFDPSHQDSSLYYHLKLQIIAEKLLAFNKKILLKQFQILYKTEQLLRKVQKRQKRIYFEAFIINQELIFEQKKNEIVCDKYLQQKQQTNLKQIFDYLKQNFFTFPKQKVKKSIEFSQKSQKQAKQKIFRCLKIAWYDQKVKKQIQLYYLSKLFSHFTGVIKAEKQLKRNKCLSFYCHNIKRRYFQHLKEGVGNLQAQRIQRDNASWHYAFGLQRKVFDAWKNRLSYKDKYISLAMTTKNTFKETGDQKWLQIKTVDFRQIKYQ